MRYLIAILLAMTATSAHAQAVYRCAQKGKPVTFQSQPCSGQARLTAVRPYTPERSPTASELSYQRAVTDAQWRERVQAMRGGTAASAAQVSGPDASNECAQAKANRDAWERQYGLNRSIDGLREWQEIVHRACR